MRVVEVDMAGDDEVLVVKVGVEEELLECGWMETDARVGEEYVGGVRERREEAGELLWGGE